MSYLKTKVEVIAFENYITSLCFRLYGEMTMEVILSVAFGLQTDFQTMGDKTVKQEAMYFFCERRYIVFIGMSCYSFAKYRLLSLYLLNI